MDVLAAPADAKKLSVIASLACIIVLGICILFKNTFASLSVSRHIGARAVPALLAFGLLTVGILLAAQYAGGREKLIFISQLNTNATYLLIFPCLVAALGVTLMASYSQFYGAQLEAKIDQKLLDRDKNRRVKQVIEHYVSVLTASTDKIIGKFTDSILKQFDGSIQRLNAGYVECSGPQIQEMQKTLLEHFQQSLYAVSDRDLKFWLNGFSEPISSADNLIAKEYLRLNIEAVSHKTKVTRIFIFEDCDFNHNQAGIVSVLKKHEEAGIGWAVLLYEELPAHLKTAQQSLNFALLNGQSALAIFSNYNMDHQRRLYVLLDIPSPQQSKIGDYAKLHGELIPQCWLASQRFCEVHNKDATPLETAIEQNKDQANALNFGSGNIIKIEDESQIAVAIDFVRNLRRKNMLYWGEVVSQNVIDLEGTWTYAVKGTEPDGTVFEHHGIARGIIEDGNAYFSGTRQLTRRREGGKEEQTTRLAAPWRSSSIQFGDDGKMEYMSAISVEGAEVRGFGEIRFSADRNKLKGEIHLILDRDKAISADVEFERRAQPPKRSLNEAEHRSGVSEPKVAPEISRERSPKRESEMPASVPKAT